MRIAGELLPADRSSFRSLAVHPDANPAWLAHRRCPCGPSPGRQLDLVSDRDRSKCVRSSAGPWRFFPSDLYLSGGTAPFAWDSFLCNSLSSNSQCRRGRQAPRRAGVGVDSCLPNGVCRYRVHHISATRNARQAITSTVVINSGLRATRSFQALYIVAPSSRENNFWARTHSPAVAGWQRS